MPTVNLGSENHYKEFPTQTPEIPIVLTDKQFSGQMRHQPTQNWQQQENPQNQSVNFSQATPIYQQQYRQPSHQSQQQIPYQQEDPHYMPRHEETSGGWKPQYTSSTNITEPNKFDVLNPYQEKPHQPYYHNQEQVLPYAKLFAAFV